MGSNASRKTISWNYQSSHWMPSTVLDWTFDYPLSSASTTHGHRGLSTLSTYVLTYVRGQIITIYWWRWWWCPVGLFPFTLVLFFILFIFPQHCWDIRTCPDRAQGSFYREWLLNCWLVITVNAPAESAEKYKIVSGSRVVSVVFITCWDDVSSLLVVSIPYWSSWAVMYVYNYGLMILREISRWICLLWAYGPIATVDWGFILSNW